MERAAAGVEKNEETYFSRCIAETMYRVRSTKVRARASIVRDKLTHPRDDASLYPSTLLPLSRR